ncbi:hypothetical protein HWV62_11459 [Athelia sp. TMB]|nr:hypothetical protein HWV62_11459 [Athelia sp. TMB]
MSDSVQEHVTAIAGPPPITDASSPFDDADADVILRSSDHVDFRAFKVFLSFGSPFFRDMFRLPQSAADDSESRDGLPVISVPEAARTLQTLLTMCYPMEGPVLDKLEDIDLLLEASIKYAVEKVEKRVREALVAPQHLQNSALRVYAIADRHNLDAEAKEAARALANVSDPILQSNRGSELEFLSAAKLFHLLQYHKDCRVAAHRSITQIEPSQWPGLAEYLARPHYCSECKSAQMFRMDDDPQIPDAISESFHSGLPDRAAVTAILEGAGSLSLTCLVTFDRIKHDIAPATDGTQPRADASAPFDSEDADVTLRSSDNIDFKVFRLFLSFGSTVFRDMLLLPRNASDESEAKGGLPVIQLPETARTLQLLLSMSYPMGALEQPFLDRLEDVDHLLEAAIKYKMEKLVRFLRATLITPKILRGNEIRVFAIAYRHELDAETRTAARATLEHSFIEMKSGPELEYLSATTLLLLFEYHQACIKSAREALADINLPVISDNGDTRNFTVRRSEEKLKLEILDRIPSRRELKHTMAARAVPLRLVCNSCSRSKTEDAINIQSILQISREATSTYLSQLEDAISRDRVAATNLKNTDK